MNIFRLAGDLIHLWSILLLLFKLKKSNSAIGISCRMQEIYAIVFVCRYLDLFWSFISVYNTVMKSFFIISTFYLIWLMRHRPPISSTYERDKDNFQYEKYFLPPALFLGLLTSDSWGPTDILWSSSIWLECVAIFPQMLVLRKLRDVENMTSTYVVAMGSYRILYMVNWIYRWYFEGRFILSGWIAAIIQTVLYADFMYYYAISKSDKVILPVAA